MFNPNIMARSSAFQNMSTGRVDKSQSMPIRTCHIAGRHGASALVVAFLFVDNLKQLLFLV
ncbi:hypothetical protein [Comamonas sp. 26]|uniref:hypothetical protein n=1 Tax=Comamonas sp. 26 TaxID=2035201 RepID=UPI0013043148|nr:hypothetical protein [Comamonas sp. 26]